jgi:uncharacterized protein
LRLVCHGLSLVMTKKSWLGCLFSPRPPSSEDLQVCADEGGGEAQNNLGAFFAHTNKLDAAAVCYRKAAEHGNAMAQNNLAMMYAAGEGVPHDDGEASKWFLRAATQGNAGAQFHLAGRFHRASLAMGAAEAGEARIQAFKWFQLSSAQSYPCAEASRESVNLLMTRDDVAEGNRRVFSFVVTPESAIT